MVVKQNGGLLPAALSLKGRKALVTGAANGIGRSTARCLAELGADLVLSDREPLDAVIQEVRALGSSVIALQGDLTDDAHIAAILSNGPFFAFASVAGVFRAPGNPSPVEAFDFVMHVNVRAPLTLASAIIEQIDPAVGGYIVLVGSSAGRSAGGRLGTPTEYATYAASKGGVHTLVRALSRRAAERNVLINGVAPGVVRTPLLDSVSPALATSEAVSPLKRAAEPDELAWPIALLCSPVASYMSGALLDVNGGSFVG
jgi:3-oxoacyl-[acyl-carrier protein] reductase